MYRNRPFAKKSAPGMTPSVSCAWVKAHCFDYLDGELDAMQAQALETHTASCSACRQELASSRRTEQALSSALATVPPAGDLRPGFYARLAETRPMPHPPWRWQIAVPALALGLVVLALVAQPHQPSPSAVSSETLVQVKQHPDRTVAGETAATEAPHQRLQSPTTTGASMPIAGGKGHLAANEEAGRRRFRRATVDVALVRRRLASAFARRSAQQVAMVHHVLRTPSSLVREQQSRTFGLVANANFSEAALEQRPIRVSRSGLQAATDSSEGETVLTVEDDVRGFRSSTRIASDQGNSEGEAVISIDAEDTPTSNSASKPQ